MPEEGVSKLRHEEILTIEEIENIVRAAASLGITKVRLTGGEPLVRRGIADICRRVAAVPGIAEIYLTTNGTLLPKFAAELREAGIKRLNISLDSLDPETYRTITRGGKLSEALRGIDAARAEGFDKMKINAVLMGGVNDRELRKLAELSHEQGIHVRFIEYMPIGCAADGSDKRYLPGEAVLAALPELEPLGIDGVARLYALPGASGTIGIISPMSKHFCPSCNRIRVTSDGKLKPCLHSAEEIDLRGLQGDQLFETMREAILGKPLRHAMIEDESGRVSHSASKRGMNAIGG